MATNLPSDSQPRPVSPTINRIQEVTTDFTYSILSTAFVVLLALLSTMLVESLIAKIILFLGVWAVFLVAPGGFFTIGPLERGVPLLAGQRIKGFYFKGWGFWVPFLGGVLVFNVDVQTTTHNKKNGTQIEDVITADDNNVKVSVTYQWQIVDPYLASGVQNVGTWIDEVIARQIRWFATYFILENLTKKKAELSNYIDGTTAERGKTIATDVPHPETGNLEVDPAEPDFDVVAKVQPVGVSLISAVASNIDQPKEVSDAAAQRRKEEIERESEETQIKARISQTRLLMEGLGLKDPRFALLASQVEVGKRDGIDLTGGENEGDFTRGAAVSRANGEKS